VLTPGLTTVRQPMPEMGKMAVSLVAEGIAALQEKRKIVSTHRVLTPELIVRASTCSVSG
jgi:DNA-binding LacI/PurR family transcriptional regulator